MDLLTWSLTNDKMLSTSFLNNGVAARIDNVDISTLSASEIEEIKDCLHKHLVVVIKKQDVGSFNYTRFIEQIGKIANYSQMAYSLNGEFASSKGKPTSEWNLSKESYPVQRVTGKKNSKNNISGIFGTGILDWHANLNGLDRADGVALQGFQDCENTSTSFLNTNLAYLDMPDDLKDAVKNTYAEYEYSPEVWAKGLPKQQLTGMLKNKSKYKMWLVQKNIKGIQGIYFYTNNRCKIITKDNTLYNKLYQHIFQEKYIYQHFWEPGDIVLMDQLLTLHKRDQNDPDILEKRILHRITFKISNYNNYIATMNNIK